jgi:hypothetical protein
MRRPEGRLYVQRPGADLKVGSTQGNRPQPIGRAPANSFRQIGHALGRTPARLTGS